MRENQNIAHWSHWSEKTHCRFSPQATQHRYQCSPFGNLNFGNKFKELYFSAQNVVTLDGEVMAVNGRVLSGHNDMSEYF